MKSFTIICLILFLTKAIKGIQTCDGDDDEIVLKALFEKLNWLIVETTKLKENLNDIEQRQIFNENLRISNGRNTKTEIRELFNQQDLNMQKFHIELKQQMLNKFEQQAELYKNTSAELHALKTFNSVSFKENRQWLCVLRHQDGSVDFQRNWLAYKEGFGHAYGEFFIGLEKLHAKTTYEASHELLFILQDFNNETRYAKYDDFLIGSEQEKYKIKRIGKYHGDAGDSFSQHLNAKFSTAEQDNDEDDTSNCADMFRSGWWFTACYTAHLTAPYLNHSAIAVPQERGIVWISWHDSKYSLKLVEIFIKAK